MIKALYFEDADHIKLIVRGPAEASISQGQSPYHIELVLNKSLIVSYAV